MPFLFRMISIEIHVSLHRVMVKGRACFSVGCCFSYNAFMISDAAREEGSQVLFVGNGMLVWLFNGNQVYGVYFSATLFKDSLPFSTACNCRKAASTAPINYDY